MREDDDFFDENDTINSLIQYDSEKDDTDSAEETDGGEISLPKTHINANTEKNDLYGGVDDDSSYFEYYRPPARKKKKSGTGLGILIGTTVGIILIIAFIAIDSGVIGRYKDNFANNFSRVFANFKSDKVEYAPTIPPDTRYDTNIKNSMIISFDGANNTEFMPYRGGFVCAKMNYLSFMDETGETLWEMDTAIVDPILKTAGNYILLAENNRNKICLYDGKKLLYDTDDPDTIMAANVSSNGDVVVVTDKSSYKGGISVYNKSGACIFSWASGRDKVISADISASSRRVAVSLLNTDTSAKSSLLLFDVNQPESFAKIDAADTVIFDMKFAGDTLNAFGDNRVLGISSSGKIKFDHSFSEVQLTHSAIDSGGNKIFSFDDGNIPMINVFNSADTLKGSVTLTGVTDFIDINGKKILYNSGRDVYFGNVNTKAMLKYTAAMDIKKLFIISKNCFIIVYSNSLELVTV